MGGAIFVLGFRTYLEVARDLQDEEVETDVEFVST
jgi:hypothetical protein